MHGQTHIKLGDIVWYMCNLCWAEASFIV